MIIKGDRAVAEELSRYLRTVTEAEIWVSVEGLSPRSLISKSEFQAIRAADSGHPIISQQREVRSPKPAPQPGVPGLHQKAKGGKVVLSEHSAFTFIQEMSFYPDAKEARSAVAYRNAPRSVYFFDRVNNKAIICTCTLVPVVIDRTRMYKYEPPVIKTVDLVYKSQAPYAFVVYEENGKYRCGRHPGYDRVLNREAPPQLTDLTISVPIPVKVPNLYYPALPLELCDEDPDQILECYTRLDQAKADILTTVAEMGKQVKTLQDITLDTLSWAAKMRRGAAFKALIKKHKVKNERTRRRLFQLENELIYTGTKREYYADLRKARADARAQQRKLDKLKRKQLRRRDRLGHTYDGVTSRLSKHWLRTLYGVVPGVLSVADIVETLERARPIFERRKVTWQRPLDVDISPGDGFSPVVNNSTLRRTVFGKMKFEPDRLNFQRYARQYGKFNPLLTAWELIPLSFVIDWFVDIGTRLSTLDTNPMYEMHMMTSWKRVYNAQYEKEVPGGKIVYKLTGQSYHRRFTAKHDRFRLSPTFDLNIYQSITSFALIWQMFIKRNIRKLGDLHE